MNSFRVLPESATRTWSIRELSLSAEPTGEKAMDTSYESPIREIKLDVRFLNKEMIESLPYVVDDDTFIPEWEFADDSWNELVEGITNVITDYNKKVISRARELDLRTVSVIGKAKTTYNAYPDSKPSSYEDHAPPQRRSTDPIPNTTQVETIYEPSIRSSSTRRSSKIKLSPIEAWISKSSRRR
jgi:hypothetical protein